MYKCLECEKPVPMERIKASGRQICIKCAEHQEKIGIFPRYKMGFISNDNPDDPEVETYIKMERKITAE